RVENNSVYSHMSKEIYFTVQPGETLADIANIYGIDIKKIADFNGLSSPYTLSPGQRLQMPVSSGDNFIIQTEDEYSSDGMLVDTSPQPRTQPFETFNQTPSHSAENTTHSIEGYHTVQQGETLFGIAKLYRQDYRQIADWNSISSQAPLKVGTVLRLMPPEITQHSTPSVSKTVHPTPWGSATKSNTVSHIVQRGETLFSLAQRYGYTVIEIARWNGLEPPYKLSLGQSLQVALLPTSQPSIQNDHTVAGGETLYSISRHYDYPVSEIAAWNKLPPPYNLSVGQQLRVYPPSGIQKTVARQKHTSARSARYHMVARRDTLYSISKRYGYSVAKIATWNNLRFPYHLSVGKALRVSPTTGNTQHTCPLLSSPTQMPHCYHTVKSGETLKNIATKYGLSVHDLSKFNGIGSPYTIYPKQKLWLVPR
ncbi:MAG: hypothetical protein DRR19_29905, partial [Candidatus Parabeggiatoa sp. nov. 1]